MPPATRMRVSRKGQEEAEGNRPSLPCGRGSVVQWKCNDECADGPGVQPDTLEFEQLLFSTPVEKRPAYHYSVASLGELARGRSL